MSRNGSVYGRREGQEIDVLVIHSNNEVKETPLNPLLEHSKTSLEAMQLASGIMYVGTGSSVNIIATRLLQMVGLVQPDTWILGPVIVVGLPDREGYPTNVPPKLRSLIKLLEAGIKAEEKRSAAVSP